MACKTIKKKSKYTKIEEPRNDYYIIACFIVATSKILYDQFLITLKYPFSKDQNIFIIIQ